MKSLKTFLTLGLLAAVAAPTVHAVARTPNVILIVSDDQGYSDLGIMGIRPIVTPHLDRLAREGVRGTDFYVTRSACTPSRGSILTGRYSQRNGLYDMVRNEVTGRVYSLDDYAYTPEMLLGLDPREVTIGNVLQDAGYSTGVVGKWDMGQARRFLPLQRGFDYFYGHGNNGIDYYTHERYGVPSMFRNNERTTADKGKYATDVFRREAVGFIRRNKDRPFFLYLAFNAPHTGSNLEKDYWQVPESYIHKYYPGEDPKNKLVRYFAMVSAMDEAIGEVRSTLQELQIDDTTLIVFLSDNGGTSTHGNAPLKGSKSTVWEGGVRVPFIAWWPGRLPAGVVTGEFLTALELLPTIASAAGARLDADITLDGFDMLPVLRGQVKSLRREMYWERRSIQRGARVDNWKWVDMGAKGGGLFDLSKDIGEENDLSDQRPEILANVKGKYATWKKQMDATEPRGPFRDY